MCKCRLGADNIGTRAPIVSHTEFEAGVVIILGRETDLMNYAEKHACRFLREEIVEERTERISMTEITAKLKRPRIDNSGKYVNCD